MSYDEEWLDQTWENRRLMIQKTIRPITLEDLKRLGEKRFPIVTDPWCIRYNEFLATHPDARFYHADVPEHAEIIYCADTGKGIWFLPGKGMGIIQSKGLEIISSVVAGL